MPTVPPATRYAMAAGALDPGDALALLELARVDADLARALARASTALGLGLAWPGGGRDLDLLPRPTLGGGHRVALRVRGEPGDRPVVASPVTGLALHPAAPEQLLPLERFPHDGEGYVLELALPEGPAPQLRVLLLPEGHAVDWDAPPEARWTEALAAAARGELVAWELAF